MFLTIDEKYSVETPVKVSFSRELNAIELYSGAGGMSLGLRAAGIRVLKAIDASAAAVETYNRNLGYHAEQADLADLATIIPALSTFKPDLVVGGPPCQDFSSAGARAEGDRANHTRVFAMYVCCIGPEWFMMENVSRARNSAAWQDAKTMLTAAGYGMSEMVIDASFYGVPQKRRRLVVIGRKGERDGFMDAAVRNAASSAPMSLRALFGDRFGDHVYSHPRAKGRRGVWSADGPSPTVRNARRPKPAKYEPHPNDSNYGSPAEASEVHAFTRADVSLIQGFPPEWDWSGCLSGDADQMIANAVPPPVAASLGAEIRKRHFGETLPEVSGNYGQWLARKRRKNRRLVANLKWRVKLAWTLLGGRDRRCVGAEMLALETAMDLEGLSDGKKSDIRRALRGYREWQQRAPA